MVVRSLLNDEKAAEGLSRKPFVPAKDRQPVLEKVLIHYGDGTNTEVRGYVLAY